MFLLESGSVRNQGNRDSQLKGDHIAAQRGHMYIMIKMNDLFGLVNDLEKIIYGLGFTLNLKRNNNERALHRVIANPAAVANDGNIEIRDISLCVPSIDSCNDNRIIVQKGLNKENNTMKEKHFTMKGKHFIRMYPMLLTSYLILVWRVVLKDHNI